MSSIYAIAITYNKYLYLSMQLNVAESKTKLVDLIFNLTVVSSRTCVDSNTSSYPKDLMNTNSLLQFILR